jgi:hypothetical protein
VDSTPLESLKFYRQRRYWQRARRDGLRQSCHDLAIAEPWSATCSSENLDGFIAPSADDGSISGQYTCTAHSTR